MKSKKNLFLTVAVLMVFINHICMAQVKDNVPYYININRIAEGTVYEISDFKLQLEYNDVYGKTKELMYKIYDWKRTVVATLVMDKSLGLNNYTLNLGDLYSAWELDKIYIGELIDEAGTLYKLPLRLVTKPKMPGPVVDIVVNPLHVGCDNLSQSMVEFYGTISGGKAPYTVNWYVLNNTRTDFLYQPKEETIALAGKTPRISVDKNPAYYVAFYVKDACGNEQKKIVNLTCGENKKQINTVFVEESNVFLQKQKIK